MTYAHNKKDTAESSAVSKVSIIRLLLLYEPGSHEACQGEAYLLSVEHNSDILSENISYVKHFLLPQPAFYSAPYSAGSSLMSSRECSSFMLSQRSRKTSRGTF